MWRAIYRMLTMVYNNYYIQSWNNSHRRSLETPSVPMRGNNILPFDWLIIYGFTFRSIIFHLYGEVTITGEGLQNLGLCLALRAFEQEEIFIVPQSLWHWASVFPLSSEGPLPYLVVSYDTQDNAEDLILPRSPPVFALWAWGRDRSHIILS
jgi:hypothetical protein